MIIKICLIHKQIIKVTTTKDMGINIKLIPIYVRSIWNNLLIYFVLNALLITFAEVVSQVSILNIKYYNSTHNLKC